MTFSITTPLQWKADVQAIYATTEKLYVIARVDDMSHDKDWCNDFGGPTDGVVDFNYEDSSIRKPYSIDANTTLPIEIYVNGVTDEWLKNNADRIDIRLDGDEVLADFYSEQSDAAKETLQFLYPQQNTLKRLYVTPGTTFKINGEYQLEREQKIIDAIDYAAAHFHDDETLPSNQKSNTKSKDALPKQKQQDDSYQSSLASGILFFTTGLFIGASVVRLLEPVLPGAKCK